MCVCETINIFNQLLFEGFFFKNKYSVDYFIYLCVNSSNLMIYKSTRLSCNLSPSLVLDQSLYHVFYIYIYIDTHIYSCLYETINISNQFDRRFSHGFNLEIKLVGRIYSILCWVQKKGFFNTICFKKKGLQCLYFKH
jgi:hypothetical protein